MTGNTEVVVIGGGYAGVMAANRLTQRDDVTVTLINPRPKFVQRLRLHQLVGGSHDAVADYRDILAEGVRLVVDTVTRIEVAERRVTMATGDPIGYDYLVYAVGSGRADLAVPGASEFAYSVVTLEEAQRLRSVLDATPAQAAVTVVGSGPTGIETAAELAEVGRKVTLVCGKLLGPYLNPRGRRTVAKELARLGVTVIEGPDATVTAVSPEAVRLGDGRELPSRVTIWTAGFGVPDLARHSGLSTDAYGRLLTDETLTSVDDPRVVATGDSAAPSGLPLRMSCQAARPPGEQPAPIDVGLVGHCTSLGRRAAALQVGEKVDTGGIAFGGPLAVVNKEISCKGMVKELAREARKPGAFTWWFKDKTRRQLLQAKHGKASAVAEPPA